MEERIKFQKGSLEDIEEIFNVFSLSIKTMREIGIDQWDEIYPNLMDIEEDIKKEELYVGKIDDSIVAVYVINKECEEEYADGKWSTDAKEYIIIHRLVVHPGYQKQGIGGKTLKYIEISLKEQGIEALRLDAFTENPYALRMYSKAGYQIVGEANWRKGRFYLMEKVL